MTKITYPKVSDQTPRTTQTAAYVIDPVNQQSYTLTIDQEGNKEKTVFDGIGRKIIEQEENPSRVLTSTKTISYNALGQIESETDGNGQKTTFDYDPINRPIVTTFPDNSKIQKSYDDAGRKVTTTNQLGNLTIEYSDELNRVIQLDKKDVGANKTITSKMEYEYTDDPFQTKETDFNGNITVYKNNDFGNLNQVTQWVNGVPETTSFKYNLQGALAEKIFSDKSKVQYQYDEWNRLLSKTDPSNKVEKYLYDVNGNLTEVTDRKQVVQLYQYDRLNRLINTTKGSQTVSYSYTIKGQRKTMTDGTGITGYEYFPNGALKSVTYPDQRKIDYQYDNNGNRTKMTDPFGSQINYSYDGLNRLDFIKIGSNSLKEIDLDYNPAGRVTQAIQGNGIKTIYSFDGFQNLKSVNHFKSNTVIGSYSYNYDNNSNIVSKTENGITENFTYDSLDRVSTSTNGNQTYGFDGKGNRITVSSELTIPAISSGYEYDEFNRLTQVKQNGKVISQYRYNGDNLLSELTQDGVTTRYYYDGNQVIAEGVVGANGQVTLKAKYLRAGSKLVNREDSTSTKGYYLHNGHGDVLEIRDQSGNLLNSYSYDIWGNPSATIERVPNPFRYSGEFWDQKTSLQYLRARWYDPSLGRFITEDTYEGDVNNPQSLNCYTYVHNNPLKFIDPSGNDAIIITNPNLAGGFGHTSGIFQDSNGDWNYFYWGNNNVQYYKVDDPNALKDLKSFNEWGDKKGYAGFNKGGYQSSTYIKGDFTKSSYYAGQLAEGHPRKGENTSYFVFGVNCMNVTFRLLSEGVLSDGSSVSKFIDNSYGDYTSPNVAGQRLAGIFYNNAFTLKEYTLQLKNKLSEIKQMNWLIKSMINGRQYDINRIKIFLGK